MSKTLIVKLILLLFFFGPNTTKFISRAMQQCATNTKQKKKPLIKHFCADASRDARHLSDFSKLQQAFYVESVTA